MRTISVLTALVMSLQSPPASGPAAPEGNPQDQANEKARERSYFEYRNTDEGLTFKIDNGRVELTVPDENAKGQTQTYQSTSFDELKRQHPELVKKYALDHLAYGVLKPGALEKWRELWTGPLGEDQRERFRRFWNELPKDAPEAAKELERWFATEHRHLQDLERRFSQELPRPSEGHPRQHAATFGVFVRPLSDELRSQLGLKPQEGLIVEEVEKGSLAERSGVEKHDVLLTLSGQTIEDMVKFRERMVTALVGEDFVLELIRAGTRLKLMIHPYHS